MCQNFSFLSLNNIPLYVCTTFFAIIHPLMDTGCFRLLAIVSNAAVNVGVQISVLLGICIPRSGIAGSYDNSIFDILKSCHTVFHSTCSALHTHVNARGSQFLYIPSNTIFPFPFPPLLFPPLPFFFFLIIPS